MGYVDVGFLCLLFLINTFWVVVLRFVSSAFSHSSLVLSESVFGKLWGSLMYGSGRAEWQIAIDVFHFFSFRSFGTCNFAPFHFL